MGRQPALSRKGTSVGGHATGAAEIPRVPAFYLFHSLIDNGGSVMRMVFWGVGVSECYHWTG